MWPGLWSFFLLPGLAAANVYDHVMPRYLTGCHGGCVDWAAAGRPSSEYKQISAGTHCSDQGRFPITTVAECEFAATRLRLGYSKALATALANESTSPYGCYLNTHSEESILELRTSLPGLYFNPNASSKADGSRYGDMAICSSNKGISQEVVNAMFANGTVPSGTGASCAMPSQTAGRHECDCGAKDPLAYLTDSYAGPWCVCADGTAAYCTPPSSVVEQLNLQLAAADVVVAAFVTYEPLPQTPALAMLGTSTGSMKLVEGSTHVYRPPGRAYLMHYVAFRGLQPRQRYFYKVKSGSEACSWTEVFSFRAPYSAGVTKIATYGDMGHSLYNNMANMKADCEAGVIDAIVHMGDHAYDMGMINDRRGDAYMNVFQPVLSGCPWMPIIGNHEGNDGDHFKRYEQMAEGEVIGKEAKGIRSTAPYGMDRTALGQHITLGSLYAAGSHGTVPSNTSRYTSTDFGLIHLVGVDLETFDAAQIAWLDKDLQAAVANRARVPWIMVAAHYPVFSTEYDLHANCSAEAYWSEKGESLCSESVRFQQCPLHQCNESIAEWHARASSQIEPLLLKYQVDIMNTAHIHNYQSMWPMRGGKPCQHSFENPTCPVYLVEGNGGVPGCAGSCSMKNCTGYCRKQGGECGAHGRITITGAQTLTYEHIQNADGRVLDTWTITQTGRAGTPDAVVV